MEERKGLSYFLNYVDYWLLFAVIFLLGIGILMVYSTTAVQSQEYYGDTVFMVRKHFIHVLIGMLFCFLAYRINPDKLYQYSVPILLFSLLLLALTLIPGIGHVAGGARRWLVLGPIRLQPGELAKLAALIYFSSYIQRHKYKMREFKAGVLVPFVVLAMFASTLLLEPDFGSTVVILVVVFSQIFLYVRPLHIIIVVSSAIVGLGTLVLMSPYRFKRLVTFSDPFFDASGSGYQLVQSLIAVGSGGLNGLGLGNGKQKLFYLPAAHTDFIFAVIAEELGIMGVILVICLFLIILFRGIAISRRLISKPYLSSLAIGCTTLMVIPAFLNMGVVSGLLPTKGMVLPLVAYGGTAMIVHLVAMGILLRLSHFEDDSSWS